MRVKEGKREKERETERESAFFSASQMREVTFKNWRVKQLRRRGGCFVASVNVYTASRNMENTEFLRIFIVKLKTVVKLCLSSRLN